MTPLSHPTPQVNHFAVSLRAGGWQLVLSPGELARGVRPFLLTRRRPALSRASTCLRLLPAGANYVPVFRPSHRLGCGDGLSNSCASGSLLFGDRYDPARDDADALHANKHGGIGEQAAAKNQQGFARVYS